jgi:hypothetical protein
MDIEWWAKKHWRVRDTGKLDPILDLSDEFWLEPNTATGQPVFYWWRFAEGGAAPGRNPDIAKKHECWSNAYFYLVGDQPYSQPTLPTWNSSEEVKKTYEEEAKKVRCAADDPHTLKLAGHIVVGKNIEYVRVLFFKGVQADGNDWVVIDARITNIPGIREDGTGHGDPK